MTGNVTGWRDGGMSQDGGDGECHRMAVMGKCPQDSGDGESQQDSGDREIPVECHRMAVIGECHRMAVTGNVYFVRHFTSRHSRELCLMRGH